MTIFPFHQAFAVLPSQVMGLLLSIILVVVLYEYFAW